MNHHITLEYLDNPSLEDEAVLLEGITHEAFKAKGMGPIEFFAVFMRDEDKTILGGVKGASFYGCLYVDSLWVDPTFRRRGWGAKLMERVEIIAKERRCRFMSVFTMDWEAMPFYRSLGFEVEFIREGYENNSKMFLMRKDLSPLPVSCSNQT